MSSLGCFKLLGQVIGTKVIHSRSRTEDFEEETHKFVKRFSINWEYSWNFVSNNLL